MNNLLDYTLEEINGIMAKHEFPKFRGAQLYNAILNGKNFSDSTVLPKDMLEQLKSLGYNMQSVKILKSVAGSGKTTKFLFKLNDDSIVEGVLMTYKFGRTLCVSTQVGCRMNCAFCASGLNFSRNLTAGEILGQIVTVNTMLGGTLKEREITNVVLMGSGEPLDNFDNVVKFLQLVTNENSLNISVRNITLSTCGIPSKIERLADLGLSINLAISLHAPNNKIRKEIMPVSKSYPLEMVLEAAEYYNTVTNRRIIIEYILIDGVNSSIKHATELADLLNGFNCHVNLINLNEVEENNFKAVSEDKVNRFLRELLKNNVSATIRRTLGEDSNSACGQLRATHLNEGKQINKSIEKPKDKKEVKPNYKAKQKKEFSKKKFDYKSKSNKSSKTENVKETRSKSFSKLTKVSSKNKF